MNEKENAASEFKNEIMRQQGLRHLSQQSIIQYEREAGYGE